MTIDSHVHFWNYDAVRDSWITDEMKILKQNFLPDQLSLHFKDYNVDGCVAVQADQQEAETLFLCQLSKEHDFIKAVVGWIDLRQDDIDKRLQYFSQFPVIKGWRHIVQAEPDGFLQQEKFQRGIQALSNYNYTYDLLLYHTQLKQALEFVQRFPQQKFVIDHCAKPGIKNKEIDDWKMYMKEMAAMPNVYCKLSGLITETNWNKWAATDFYPYLDAVFDLFGTDRLMFGSDWPVMLLSGNYRQWKNLVEKYMQDFSATDKEKIFSLNAIRFYNL
ncbi:MAG: amidohydrolase family protein [Ferruginibacter sp.]|nr:amidohydrolase family protein [Ferruginibacter sp.]